MLQANLPCGCPLFKQKSFMWEKTIWQSLYESKMLTEIRWAPTLELSFRAIAQEVENENINWNSQQIFFKTKTVDFYQNYLFIFGQPNQTAFSCAGFVVNFIKKLDFPFNRKFLYYLRKGLGHDRFGVGSPRAPWGSFWVGSPRT